MPGSVSSLSNPTGRVRRRDARGTIRGGRVGKIEEAARSLESAVESGVFKPSPGESCAECSYSSLCAYAVDK
jgi:hypothetical protein